MCSRGVYVLHIDLAHRTALLRPRHDLDGDLVLFRFDRDLPGLYLDGDRLLVCSLRRNHLDVVDPRLRTRADVRALDRVDGEAAVLLDGPLDGGVAGLPVEGDDAPLERGPLEL